MTTSTESSTPVHSSVSLAVALPDAAIEESIPASIAMVLLYFAMAVILQIPKPKMHPLQDILAGGAGTFFLLTNVLVWIIQKLEAVVSLTLLKILILVIILGLSWFGGFRLTFGILSTGYTSTYILMLIFKITNLFVFYGILIIIAIIQYVGFYLCGPIALDASHISLTAYLIICIFGIFASSMLKTFRNGESALFTAVCLRFFFLLAVLAAVGLKIWAYLLFGERKKDQAKSEKQNENEEEDPKK